VFVNMTRSGDVEDRNIWEKMYRTWIHIEENYINDFEWFVKVDDDSYLFVDNLRNFVKYYDTNVPHYFGHTLMFRWKEDNIVFNTGIAYVLSRKTLQTIVPVFKTMPTWKSGFRDRCVDRAGAGEDTNMGVCLRSIGINPDNTLDSRKRQRFLPFFLSAHQNQSYVPDAWYWKYKPRDIGQGMNCCVEDIIAMHDFKRGKTDDENYEKLEEMYYRNGRDLMRSDEIPPPPQLFLYDRMIDFEIDSHRNSLERFPNQEVYLGEGKEKQVLERTYEQYRQRKIMRKARRHRRKPRQATQ
jgi:hypothetical protein